MVITILLTLLNLLTSGLAIKFGWQWFLTPLGLPQLTFLWAVGLSLLLAQATYHASLSDLIVLFHDDQRSLELSGVIPEVHGRRRLLATISVDLVSLLLMDMVHVLQ